MKKILAT